MKNSSFLLIKMELRFIVNLKIWRFQLKKVMIKIRKILILLKEKNLLLQHEFQDLWKWLWNYHDYDQFLTNSIYYIFLIFQTISASQILFSGKNVLHNVKSWNVMICVSNLHTN